MDAEEATQKWRGYQRQVGAITDELGDSAKYKERVAIKKADLVRFQDIEEKSRRTESATKEKKGTEEEIRKHATMMQGEAKFASSSDQALDMSRAAEMMKARQASALASGGMSSSGFNADGRGAAAIPDVKSLEPEEIDDGGSANDDPASKRRRTEETQSTHGSDGGSPPKPAAEEHWYEGDELISKALKSHSEWVTKLETSASEAIVTSKALLRECDSEIYEYVKVEACVLKSRAFALQLHTLSQQLLAVTVSSDASARETQGTLTEGMGNDKQDRKDKNLDQADQAHDGSKGQPGQPKPQVEAKDPAKKPQAEDEEMPDGPKDDKEKEKETGEKDDKDKGEAEKKADEKVGEENKSPQEADGADGQAKKGNADNPLPAPKPEDAAAAAPEAQVGKQAAAAAVATKT